MNQGKIICILPGISFPSSYLKRLKRHCCPSLNKAIPRLLLTSRQHNHCTQQPPEDERDFGVTKVVVDE